MLIGVLSDTHDDMEMIRRAVDFFNAKKVKLVLHAGDIVSPFTFPEAFINLVPRFAGVFGNNDGDKVLLTEKSGGRILQQPRTLEEGGKKIVLMHEPALIPSLVKSGTFDIIIYGHTHRPDVKKENGVLVLNPGKTARLHKGKSTVALMETDTLEAEIHQLI
ncbi:MAG: metallophosphoesterase [Nitrospiraceae bacterium]|nr:metallophosphoesterase [Nitrospiraceae bacterium]